MEFEKGDYISDTEFQKLPTLAGEIDTVYCGCLLSGGSWGLGSVNGGRSNVWPSPVTRGSPASFKIFISCAANRALVAA
jgi:hypothetical protein